MFLPSEQGLIGWTAPPAVLRPAGVSNMGGQLQWRGSEHPSVQTAPGLSSSPSHHLQVMIVPALKCSSLIGQTTNGLTFLQR